MHVLMHWLETSMQLLLVSGYLILKHKLLELQASSGLYTHHQWEAISRIPMGQLKIGMIAETRLPQPYNAVIGDPRVNDQQWAKQEGMVAFAGYPLLVEDRVVGVMASLCSSCAPHHLC